MFTIKGEGRWDASANTLLLKETYQFEDGHHDQLIWTIINRARAFMRAAKHSSMASLKADNAEMPFDGNITAMYPWLMVRRPVSVR